MSRSEDDEYDDRPKPRRSRPDEPEDGERPRRRRRRRDDDDLDDDSPRSRAAASESNGMAVAGLILGFLSLCTGVVVGIPAIVCSVIALKKTSGKAMAVAGLVLGVLGTTAGSAIVIALLLPAVQQVREAASRTKETSNLKQIGMAMHSYNDTRAELPPAAGKVSWRVELLPYIEQSDLYHQFDLKQAWDGPQNGKLADAVISTYASPLDAPGTTHTHYRVFVGPGTLYEPGKKPKRFPEVTDGVSNTLFAVEAEESIPWPQPKELEFSPDGPLPALGHPDRNIVLVAMIDGSVKPIDKKKMSPTLLRALITPDAGDKVPGDW